MSGGGGKGGVLQEEGVAPVEEAAACELGKEAGRRRLGGRAATEGLLLTTANDCSKISTRAWAAAADRRASSSWV